MEFNEFQSTIESLNLSDYPEEVIEQFWDFINNIPFIQNLISPNRPRAKDLPRDEEGKIIVDITKPHILEDMNYFRPSYLMFKNNNRYTDYKPNSNKGSEFYSWYKEEIRRCHEGYIREDDGEWIPGDLYFFWNYTPMMVTKVKSGKSAIRILDFPDIWEGHYLWYHYLYQARKSAKHAAQLASRSKGKSYTLASLATKRFVLGETIETTKEVKCFIAAYQKEYLNKDGVLNKFEDDIDFLAENTEFPSKKLKKSLTDMNWKMGYVDLDTNTSKGTLNEVIGVSVKEDEGKLRGKRGALIGLEEFGSFPSLLALYNTLRPSMEEGDFAYGQIVLQGTTGDDESDFFSAQEICFNADGYNIYSVENVYDKLGTGKNRFVFFFPGYLNRKGCYDENGNSDVIKASLEILRHRYKIKYNSTDITTITKTIAEIPFTPSEAVLRAKGNKFPITQLTERLNQIDTNPNFFDDIYSGQLIINTTGDVVFKPTSDLPIRDFPLKNSKAVGAVEIYVMPVKDSQGKVQAHRYCAGIDPLDDDYSNNSVSLFSIIIFDLFTDVVVAEYTGRYDVADYNYEVARQLLLFYNATALYEQNKKGIFSYFKQTHSLYLLADTPKYLRDIQVIKELGTGNKSKGVVATEAINNYADTLIKEWLIKTTTITKTDDEGNVEQYERMNLYTLCNRALIKELIAYNPNINVDRVRAFGMLMLYRQHFMSLYNGDIRAHNDKKPNYKGNDSYFTKNYKNTIRTLKH